jgi:hypothetical protein
VEEENIDLSTYANVTSPAVKRFFKVLAAWNTSGSLSTWAGLTRPFSSAVVSTPVVICGSFYFLTIAIWATDLLVNPYTQATGGLVDLTVNLFCSCGVRMPKAFGMLSDISLAKTGTFSPDEVALARRLNSPGKQRVILWSQEELELYFLYQRSGDSFTGGLAGMVQATEKLFPLPSSP